MKPSASVSILIAKLSALRDGHRLVSKAYETVIADLFTGDHSDDVLTEEVREAIRDSVPRKKERKRKVKVNKKESKPYSYKGKHWTQTPEGKKKLSRIMKKSWKSGRMSKQQREYAEQT